MKISCLIFKLSGPQNFIIRPHNWFSVDIQTPPKEEIRPITICEVFYHILKISDFFNLKIKNKHHNKFYSIFNFHLNLVGLFFFIPFYKEIPIFLPFSFEVKFMFIFFI